MYNPDVIVAVALGVVLVLVVISKISDEAPSVKTLGDFFTWLGQIGGWAISLAIVFVIAHFSIKYWSIIQSP